MNRRERREQWQSEYRSARREDFTAGSIRLHIHELVLHGFPSQTRNAIADATQANLSDLISTHGPPTALVNSNSDQVNAGTFNVSAGARASVIGGQIARAIYGGREG